MTVSKLFKINPRLTFRPCISHRGECPDVQTGARLSIHSHSLGEGHHFGDMNANDVPMVKGPYTHLHTFGFLTFVLSLFFGHDPCIACTVFLGRYVPDEFVCAYSETSISGCGG